LIARATLNSMAPRGMPPPTGEPATHIASRSPQGGAPATGNAANPAGASPAGFAPIVIAPIGFGVTPPLGELQSIDSKPLGEPDEAEPLRSLFKGHPAALQQPALADPVVQTQPGTLAMPAAVANFDGNTNLESVYPPDTNGDIGYDPASGKRYYFQWVNLHYAAWDVTNPAAPTLVVTPTTNNGNDLWQASLPGSQCALNNSGDPIVLFDEQAHRWLISQFTTAGGSGGYHQCLAVSQTANPAGSWYAYDYLYSTTLLNDYPHFGIWPDPTYNAYYMTVHQFQGTTGPWRGQGVAAFERAKLLNGDSSAKLVVFDLYTVNFNYGGMLAADLDGPPPLTGTPGLFFEVDDSGFTPGLGPTDTMRVWEFRPDWSNSLSSTFGIAGSPNYTLTVAPFSVLPCVAANALCIPQLGTSVKLDALGDRLMHRVAFRDFGAYQSIVLNQTVDAGSGVAGLRWYEVRRDPAGGAVSIYQQSTYSPDSTYRWMGSISMDQAGNLALGYSASSSSIYPAILYAGRLATDVVTSTLTQAEAIIKSGTGAQTGSLGRWGDYAMLGVDPQDGCTFWFTTEYLSTTTSTGWRTRIASFAYPSCVNTANTGLISGVVTDANTSNPIAGAQVLASRLSGVDTYPASTDVNGEYQFVGLVTGTYTLTATAAGYYSATISNVAVSASVTTTQNIALIPLPASDLSLVQSVSTTAVAGAPLTYTLSISNAGPEAITSTVTVADVLGTGATFGGVTAPGWNCAQGGATVTCDLPSLAVGAAPDIVITLTTPITAGALVNTASITATVSDFNSLDNTSVATTTLQAQADLAVSVSGPANSLPGGTLVYTIHANNLGPSSAAHWMTFTQTGVLTINDNSAASPYPTTLNVSGLSPVISLTTDLVNFNHTYPDDVDILMVAPNGSRTLLMSDAGGGVDAVNVNLTFADSAASALPNFVGLTSGTYRPTDYDTASDVFPAPAPTGPYVATLSLFTGLNPNGVWQLYVRDDTVTDTGSLDGGWNLNFLQSLTLTDTLPSGATYLGYAGAGWSCSPAGGVVTCTVSGFSVGVAPDLIITATAPTLPQVITNTALVGSLTADPDLSNNSASVTTTISPVRGVSLAPASARLAAVPGSAVTYTLTLTNTGNISDTYDVLLSGNTFTVTAPASLGPLNANVGANFVVIVTVPLTATSGSTDSVTVTARSRGDTSQIAIVTLTTQAVASAKLYLPLITK